MSWFLARDTYARPAPEAFAPVRGKKPVRPSLAEAIETSYDELWLTLMKQHVQLFVARHNTTPSREDYVRLAGRARADVLSMLERAR